MTEQAEALQAALVLLWCALGKAKSAKARGVSTKIRAAITSSQNALERTP